MPGLTKSAAPLAVLVVDDDPAVIYAARALLGRKGCRVEAAFKGLDAVARVRAGGIDALVLDVQMPEVDGLSVLEAIGGMKNPPRVVLMAEHATPAARAAVERGRALALLSKPVDFAYVHAVISGQAPEQPLALRVLASRPAMLGLARDALEGGPLSLPGEAPLPPGTPVSVVLSLGVRRAVTLVGSAQPARAGHGGLQVTLCALTPEQRLELAGFVQGLRPALAVREAAPSDDARSDRASELYLRGLRRLDQGHYAQALQDLTRARGLRENNLEYQAAERRAQQLVAAQRARGLVRRARGLALTEPREALGLFEEAIRLEPGRATHHLEAAELLLQLGEDLPLAEERLGAAIHLAPSDPTPRLHLTRLLERTGHHREALWACDAALALFPGDPELRRAEERIQRRLGSLAEVGQAQRRKLPGS